MLPYLIAGAIGFGIAKLFEEGGETFSRGGMTNEDILRSFLTSEKQIGKGNLYTLYGIYTHTMLLYGYGSLLARRIGRNVKIYGRYGGTGDNPNTPSGVIKQLKALAEEMDYSVEYVDNYAGGGGVGNQLFGNDNPDLVNFDLNELDPFEQMQYNHLSKSSSKAETLQVLINNTEGDYSQLSPRLSEIAEAQYPSDRFAGGGKISVYHLRKGDKIRTRKGDIETIERKIESGYFTKESEYSHPFESIEFVERQTKKYAGGGQINSNFAKKEWNSYLKDSKIDALISSGYSKKVARDLSSEAWESLEKNVQNAFKNYLISEEVGFMKSMMESLYVYGGIEKGSYGYDRYLSEYENILGKKMFDKIYEEELERLKEYDVEKNVYTDSEGLSYSSLKRKYTNSGEVQDELHYLVSDFDSNEYEAFCYEFDIDIDDANQMTNFISQLSDEDAKNIINQIENGYFSDSEDEYAGGGGVGKYKVLDNQYIPYKSNRAVTYYYVSDENNNIINKKTGKIYRGKQMDNYKFKNKEEAQSYANKLNGKMEEGVGEPKKRRRRANAQIGKTDRSVDKTRVAKPVGYRFTNALASKLRKDKYEIPTEKQIKKYLGKGIYKENRRNESDRDLTAKL